ncbi:MAG: hypothetical protein VKM98_08445 [Cyanobacteriota bacterium]|nr:hypothetical protein [Cyanobacteriota bacterium]
MHSPSYRSEPERLGDLTPVGSRRLTRRRSSAGPATPVPPQRPLRPQGGGNPVQRQGPRPTFLTLRDHGKVYVADLPRLSDGQLTQVAKEAKEVLDSLERRLEDLGLANGLAEGDNDMRIRAATKRDVTERFLRAIDEEQTLRRNNPALRAAAGESLPRAFLELARHRLPGSTFDALLQEALDACGPEAANQIDSSSRRVVPIVRKTEDSEPRRPLPVVLTLEASAQVS